MKELSEGVIRGIIEIEVRDKNGKLLKQLRRPMKSWVRNFLAILSAWLGAVVSTANWEAYEKNVVDVEGSVQPFVGGFKGDGGYAYTYYATIKAPEGDDTWGIVVGIGTTKQAPDDYNLENKIAHGDATGQLLYGAVTVEDPAVSNNTITMRLIRTFSNSSGGSVNVQEFGIIMYHYFRYNVSGHVYTREFKVLVARDVLDTPVSVPDGGTLTVRYIIQVTT